MELILKPFWLVYYLTCVVCALGTIITSLLLYSEDVIDLLSVGHNREGNDQYGLFFESALNIFAEIYLVTWIYIYIVYGHVSQAYVAGSSTILLKRMSFDLRSADSQLQILSVLPIL